MEEGVSPKALKLRIQCLTHFKDLHRGLGFRLKFPDLPGTLWPMNTQFESQWLYHSLKASLPNLRFPPLSSTDFIPSKFHVLLNSISEMSLLESWSVKIQKWKQMLELWLIIMMMLMIRQTLVSLNFFYNCNQKYILWMCSFWNWQCTQRGEI